MDMKASEVNGVRPFEETLARLRDGYTNALNDILDRCLEELILPADKEAILQDAAGFLLFILAIKTVEVRGQEATTKNLLAAYWPLQKEIKKTVPGMLVELAKGMQSGAAS